jgi:chemotaxis protein MotB
MREIADEVVRALAPLARTGEVRIRPSPFGIAVEISAGALFAPGEARLAPESAAALRAVAGVLAPLPNAIRIEGHTDDAPIATAQFPSNWELASARASAVARLFIDGGIVPARLVVTGHADTRPVEPNASPEGRARNRRVTVVILSQESVEPLDAAAPPAETP